MSHLNSQDKHTKAISNRDLPSLQEKQKQKQNSGPQQVTAPGSKRRAGARCLCYRARWHPTWKGLEGHLGDPEGHEGADTETAQGTLWFKGRKKRVLMAQASLY